LKKRILITGGSGLLGVNWAVTALEEFDVWLGLHQRDVKIHGVKTCFLDMSSLSSAQRCIQIFAPEIVVHAAGLTSVELCEKSSEDAKKMNVDLAVNIATACAQSNIALAHISTDHLFSGNHAMQREDDPISPQNTYASTKAFAESCVSSEWPKALIVRTNFYGWGPHYRRSFSDYILDSLRAQQEVKLFQDVHYTPILAETLVIAVHDLLRIGASGLFHVVGDERVSKYEFGLRIAKQFNLDKNLLIPVSILERKDLVPRPLDMSLSNAKTCQILGRKLGGLGHHLARLAQQEKLGLRDELLLGEGRK
jgi:dTDP-4-dehydrorhamnose reductase